MIPFLRKMHKEHMKKTYNIDFKVRKSYKAPKLDKMVYKVICERLGFDKAKVKLYANFIKNLIYWKNKNVLSDSVFMLTLKYIKMFQDDIDEMKTISSLQILDLKIYILEKERERLFPVDYSIKDDYIEYKPYVVLSNEKLYGKGLNSKVIYDS